MRGNGDDMQIKPPNRFSRFEIMAYSCILTFVKTFHENLYKFIFVYITIIRYKTNRVIVEE